MYNSKILTNIHATANNTKTLALTHRTEKKTVEKSLRDVRRRLTLGTMEAQTVLYIA